MMLRILRNTAMMEHSKVIMNFIHVDIGAMVCGDKKGYN